MKKISLFLVTFLLACSSGCAFKQRTKQNSQLAGSGKSSTQIVFAWKIDAGTRSREESQVSRVLTTTNRVQYRNDQPVTLPQNVPNLLTIIAKNTERTMTDISFIKATVVIDGKRYQLSANYLLNNAAEKSITLTFAGLHTLLSSTTSQSAELIAELFNSNEKVLTYSFWIRTPPSNVSFELKSASESLSELNVPTNFVAPIINGRKFGMIEILKIQNNDSQPIELEIPTTIQASLIQSVVRQNYMDLQCHGGDFKYWQTVWNDQYSTELKSYPIDEELLTNLEGSFGIDSRLLSKIRIFPHQYALITLYSVSDLAWLFESDMPIASTLQVKRAPAGCYVTSTDCQESAGEHSHMSCRSETRRYEKDFAIGDIRGALEISFFGERNISMRYADFDLSEDAEVRTVEAFPERIVVKR